jgi:hypothetical protein
MYLTVYYIMRQADPKERLVPRKYNARPVWYGLAKYSD